VTGVQTCALPIYFGAGSVCLYEMIKYVIDVDKVSVIDFLRGADEYKKHWVAKCRKRKGMMIYNNTIRGKYLSFVDNKIAPFVNNNKFLSNIKRIVVSTYKNAGNVE
jgi:CelD/BcsL family acetyltransferase involved in cellulose biosynthesis